MDQLSRDLVFELIERLSASDIMSLSYTCSSCWHIRMGEEYQPYWCRLLQRRFHGVCKCTSLNDHGSASYKTWSNVYLVCGYVSRIVSDVIEGRDVECDERINKIIPYDKHVKHVIKYYPYASTQMSRFVSIYDSVDYHMENFIDDLPYYDLCDDDYHDKIIGFYQKAASELLKISIYLNMPNLASKSVDLHYDIAGYMMAGGDKDSRYFRHNYLDHYDPGCSTCAKFYCNLPYNIDARDEFMLAFKLGRYDIIDQLRSILSLDDSLIIWMRNALDVSIDNEDIEGSICLIECCSGEYYLERCEEMFMLKISLYRKALQGKGTNEIWIAFADSLNCMIWMLVNLAAHWPLNDELQQSAKRYRQRVDTEPISIADFFESLSE